MHRCKYKPMLTTAMHPHCPFCSQTPRIYPLVSTVTCCDLLAKHPLPLANIPTSGAACTTLSFPFSPRLSLFPPALQAPMQGMNNLMGGAQADASLLQTLQALQAAQMQAQAQQASWNQSNPLAAAMAAMAAQSSGMKPPHLQLPVSDQLMAAASGMLSPSMLTPTPSASSATASLSLSPMSLPSSASGSDASGQLDLQAFLMAQAQLQHLQQMQQQSEQSGDLSAQLSMLINKLDSTKLGGMDASSLLNNMQQQQQQQSPQAQAQAQAQQQHQQLMASVSAAMQAATSSAGLDVQTPPIYENAQRTPAAAH